MEVRNGREGKFLRSLGLPQCEVKRKRIPSPEYSQMQLIVVSRLDDILVWASRGLREASLPNTEYGFSPASILPLSSSKRE